MFSTDTAKSNPPILKDSSYEHVLSIPVDLEGFGYEALQTNLREWPCHVLPRQIHIHLHNIAQLFWLELRPALLQHLVPTRRPAVHPAGIQQFTRRPAVSTHGVCIHHGR